MAGITDLRDFQRSRVYDAEDAVWGPLSNSLLHFDSEKDLLKWINKILAYKRVLNAFPEIAGNTVEITYCKRSKWSEADQDHIRFAAKGHFPIHALHVVHELAHWIQYKKYGHISISGHGPEFVQIYLELTRITLGRDVYDLLVESFTLYKVKF